MTAQSPQQNILKIALDVPMDRLFDYLAGDFHVEVGQRVVVPFGSRKRVGVVIEKCNSTDIPSGKLKAVLSAFNDEYPLDADTFSLLRFCADYYQYPYGQALLSALPTRLRQTEPAVSRKQYVYALTATGLKVALDEIPARQVVQRRIFSALSEQHECDESELNALSATWRKSMQLFIEKSWVSRREILAGLQQASASSAALPALNDEQVNALDAMLKEADIFKPWLLHGITGSGKTEVYMQLIQRILTDHHGQVLVLVPEINLTPQLESRFRSRLPEFPLVSLHSNLGESERLQNWQLAQSGAARIVIGTRLSVFTPLPQLRLIIVDEEHDGSYKQQDGMRYHARDIALVRAQRAKVPIVLGSATPALETWHNATTGRYGHLTLTNRAVAQSRLPDIRCIDVSRSEMQDGLSPILITAMRERLVKGEQSLLFINRRGYSPVLLCNACHWIAPCMRCSSRLVVHLRQGRLRCHHCGHEQKIVPQCPSCGNPDLHPTGHGTQRLEQTLAALMPEARILRVDRDSTRRKHALTDMLAAVHADEVDILVGTQMLAKGHDFPNLTLVGVIDTDSALFSPDFRAAERLFAQLMQVAGRAGRADKAGEVLIQTTFPEHNLFNALRVQDYKAYADALLQEREMTQFPPYAFLAVIKAESTHYSEAQQFLQQAADAARALNLDVMVYDPIRPQMERLKGMERVQLLLQANSRQPLQTLLRNLVPSLRESKLGAKIRWAVDVDPQEF
ncbi:primosomal protein N' [Methylovorus sp. MM2]|uniref:primosomal protein N' n=1 Tax=Methylovorus sp. MM2 TaxID=1848038 RepID=UPI0007DEA76E|nr:primosomal protein N' [Methylovorus sp. MM2]OAM52006.1 primosomal protein N' [Methylovorus sp. MM2]